MEKKAKAYVRDKGCSAKHGTNSRCSKGRARVPAKVRSRGRSRKKYLKELDGDLTRDMSLDAFDDDLRKSDGHTNVANKIAKIAFLQDRFMRVSMRVAARLMFAGHPVENKFCGFLEEHIWPHCKPNAQWDSKRMPNCFSDDDCGFDVVFYAKSQQDADTIATNLANFPNIFSNPPSFVINPNDCLVKKEGPNKDKVHWIVKFSKDVNNLSVKWLYDCFKKGKRV